MEVYKINSLQNWPFRFTPLERHGKRPKLKCWETTDLSIAELDDYGPFPENHNIGVRLGHCSDGLLDVDLDHPLAVKIGRALLPNTGMIWGRDSKEFSHFAYRVREAGGTKY